MVNSSLRSKRFRLVSEQKKIETRDFREKWNERQKMKVFHILTSFFGRSLILVSRSLFRNRTETLSATQARLIVIMTIN